MHWSLPEMAVLFIYCVSISEAFTILRGKLGYRSLSCLKYTMKLFPLIIWIRMNLIVRIVAIQTLKRIIMLKPYLSQWLEEIRLFYQLLIRALVSRRKIDWSCLSSLDVFKIQARWTLKVLVWALLYQKIL